MKYFLLILIALPVSLLAARQTPANKVPQGSWTITSIGNEMRIGYGSGTNFPQYGALHLTDGYFRLNYGPGSGWGTSVLLMPALWSGGHYHQGAPITATSRMDNLDLVLTITGTIAGIDVYPEVRLSPPTTNMITSQVTTRIQGSVVLDSHPGETFKPVMLSSMHISSLLWDTIGADAGGYVYSIPSSGWIIQPPITTQSLGLRGGTSCWKLNAPTIDVTMDRSLQVTGWVTFKLNPYDDNVGFWAASPSLLPSYGYTLRSLSGQGPNIYCLFVPGIWKSN